MSEYMEKHSVSRLIGSPPGYVGHEEGGQLTERVRREPYSMLLFDEIEKAHPDVSNLLLQVLEEGTLTDAYGNKVDFSSALVLMTSNVGSDLVLRGGRMGFGDTEGEDAFRRTEKEILAALKQTFRPELLNRIDEIIVFNPLGNEELRRITALLIEDVNLALLERNLRVEVDDEAQAWLLQQADTDPASGARPLRRTIQRYLQDAISDILIQGRSDEFELIEVSVEDDHLDFSTHQGVLATDRT